MPRPVGDKGNLQGVWLTVSPGRKFVQQSTNGLHDFQIGFFVPAADIVGRTCCPLGQYAPDGAAMVTDIQPVPYLLAVTVYRQRFAGQSVQDHQRNQLFRKVVRTVIVAAMGGQDRQAIGLVPGTDQMVAGRLAG